MSHYTKRGVNIYAAISQKGRWHWQEMMDHPLLTPEYLVKSRAGGM